MTTVKLKKNIHKVVEKIDDAGLLQAVYTILEKQMEVTADYELTAAQKKELDKRIVSHKNGKSKSHSWAEVKKDLLKK
jgi:putative addiction module component (TIGR02574 family)